VPLKWNLKAFLIRLIYILVPLVVVFLMSKKYFFPMTPTSNKHFAVDYLDENQDKIMSSFGYLRDDEILIEVIYQELNKIPPIIRDTITDIVIKNNLA
jgi:hypothetical protein